MEILLRFGAEVNAVTSIGQTPLDKAELKSHKLSIVFLRARGGVHGHDLNVNDCLNYVE